MCRQAAIQQVSTTEASVYIYTVSMTLTCLTQLEISVLVECYM